MNKPIGTWISMAEIEREMETIRRQEKESLLAIACVLIWGYVALGLIGGAL